MSEQNMVARAVGKCILCGEHAVVYGQPAIAIPLSAVRAEVTTTAGPAGSGVAVAALDLRERWALNAESPLVRVLRGLLDRLGAPEPDLLLSLRSNIPIAGGMGSGAAVATALVRALAQALGARLTPAEVSALVYESERAFHGTPSGIDNTVIAYERPIWFQRRPEQAPLLEPLTVTAPLALVVGDTGVPSETRASVGDLRRRWEAGPAPYEARFRAIGELVGAARAALEGGQARELGALLDANQAELEALGLSSPELDRLVTAARRAGALGAKLSGGGWGGIMLALAEGPAAAEQIAAALRDAGATRTICTTLE